MHFKQKLAFFVFGCVFAACSLLIACGDNPVWHYKRGESYYQRGQLDEAIAEYREALRIKPDLAGARHSLGLAYFAQGKLDEAIVEYQEALRLHWEALPGDAKSDRSVGGIDEGMVSYRHHKLAEVQYNLEWAIEEAIDEVQETLRTNPDHAPAHYRLACYHSLHGDLSRSLAALRRAVALDREYSEMAATDSDFDAIRDTREFQGLMDGFSNED